MTLGSGLTVAYSARFVWGAFSVKPAVTPVTSAAPSSASPLLTAPTMLLVIVGLALGVVPGVLEPLLQSYAQTAGPTHEGAMALWHGFAPGARAVRGDLADRRRGLRGAARSGTPPQRGRAPRRRVGGSRTGRHHGRRGRVRGRGHRGDAARLAAGVDGRHPAGARRVPGHHADPLRHGPVERASSCWSRPGAGAVPGDPRARGRDVAGHARAARGADGRRRRLLGRGAVHPARRAGPRAHADPGRDDHPHRGAAGAHPAARTTRSTRTARATGSGSPSRSRPAR